MDVETFRGDGLKLFSFDIVNGEVSDVVFVTMKERQAIKPEPVAERVKWKSMDSSTEFKSVEKKDMAIYRSWTFVKHELEAFPG